MRTPYYEDEEVKVAYEEFKDMVFLHCEVKVWRLSVLKKLYRLFASLGDFLVKKGYKEMATLTPNPRFAKLFGGTTRQYLEVNNEKVEYIVWELKQ